MIDFKQLLVNIFIAFASLTFVITFIVLGYLKYK